MTADAITSRVQSSQPKPDRLHEGALEPEGFAGACVLYAMDGDITAAQKMVAACSGSLLTSLLVTPLDVVRVRLQSQHLSSKFACTTFYHTNTLGIHRSSVSSTNPRSTHRTSPSEGISNCYRNNLGTSSPSASAYVLPATERFAHLNDSCLEQTSQRRFQGTWEGLVKIARHEGLYSLWRGLSPTLAMTVPANVIYFTGYDSLRFSPYSPFSSLGPSWAPLLAGGTARALAATVISPLELFKTRLQATSSHTSDRTAHGSSVFRSTLSGVRAMVARDGAWSLWRGLSLTLWRDVPFSGVYWLGYEMIKNTLRARREREWGLDNKYPFGILKSADNLTVLHHLHAENTFTDAFIAGSVSGAVAAYLTQPFDVGKTRRQVATHQGSMGNMSVVSMTKFLGYIIRREGIKGLWTGWGPRVLKVAPACAIMISSYEVGKRAAMRINQKRKLEQQYN